MQYNWKLKYYNGSSWSTPAVISNPTNDITVTRNSTQSTSKLYNGAIGRTIPLVKANYDPVDFQWSFLSASNSLLKDNGSTTLSLSSLMSAGYKVAFITHSLYSASLNTTVSQTFTGYLTAIPKVYTLGMYPNSSGNNETFYDLSCTLDIVSLV